MAAKASSSIAANPTAASSAAKDGTFAGHYDTIVIGGGIMGACSAYYLAKESFAKGKLSGSVLLLEQFGFLHNKGSSNGKSRVTRLTYPEPQFERLMPHAYRLWDEAQSDAGRKVFVETGGLDFGLKDFKDMTDLIENAKKWNTPHEVLSASEVNQRFPAFHLPDDHIGLYQPATGILDATSSVDMFIGLGRKYGATCLDHHAVTSLQRVSPSRIELLIGSNGKRFTCSKAIISVGAWLSSFLTPLHIELPAGLTVWKQSYGYYPLTDEAKKDKRYEVGQFPIFIHYHDTGFYGFPSFEQKGYVKIAPHFNMWVDEVDPDTRSMEAEPEALECVMKRIKEYMTGIDLSNGPSFTESCLYTKTTDWNFIVDYLKAGNEAKNEEAIHNIVVMGGFSGHGFKMAPLMGWIVTQMILSGQYPKDFREELSYFQLPANRRYRDLIKQQSAASSSSIATNNTAASSSKPSANCAINAASKQVLIRSSL